MSKLPKTFHELTTVLSKKSAWNLVLLFGGWSLYINKKSGSKPDYLASLDNETWEILCSHFGGETIFIPNCNSEIVAIRNNLIKQQRLSGKTLNQLSKEFKLSNRQIYTICNIGTISSVNNNKL